MEFREKPGMNENPFDDYETARAWAELVENDPFRKNYMDPVVTEWLKQPNLNKVLDIGAGQGTAKKLCQGKEYVGVEPSEELLKRAIELYGDTGSFYKGSAYEIPLPDHS